MVPRLQFHQELKHPGPDGHIEHGDGLVGHDELGSQPKDASGHDPLFLPAAQFVRILVIVECWRPESYIVEDAVHSRSDLSLRFCMHPIALVRREAVGSEDVGNRFTHGHSGTEGRLRILVNELNPLSDTEQALSVGTRHILPAEEDLARSGPHEPDEGFRNRGLPQPLSPTRPNTSPWAMEKDTP